MIGRFGAKGFGALPKDLVDVLRTRLGEDGFQSVQELGRKHGLFYQRYFKQPKASYQDHDLQLDSFAMLLTSLANQLGSQDVLVDAEQLYQLALRVRPDFLWAHQGLAILCHIQGRVAEAVAHAKEGLARLEADDDPQAPDVVQSKALLNQILAESGGNVEA